MSRKIIAISANTNPKRFVLTTHNRADKSIAVELTEDLNQAHDFVTKENAERIISRIFNPWDRIYKTEKIEVNRPIAVGEEDMR